MFDRSSFGFIIYDRRLCFLYLGQNLPTWRIPGVLQRFGVCYFVIGTLNLLTTPSEITLNVSYNLLKVIQRVSERYDIVDIRTSACISELTGQL